jgi:O-antigen biosynthesis protein WbqV
MGQPVRIVELAERMIRLSGLRPHDDIEIVFTGVRPGERLHEILFTSEEPPVSIGVAGVMAAKPNQPQMQTMQVWLAKLEQAIERDDLMAIKGVLKDAFPEAGGAEAIRDVTV